MEDDTVREGETVSVSEEDYSGYHATDEELDSRAEYGITSIELELLDIVNTRREETGVSVLTLNDDLCKAATLRAMESEHAWYKEHRRADGRPFNEFDCFDIEFSGELISLDDTANGFFAYSPTGVVNAWTSEEEYNIENREIFFNPDWTEVGVAIYSNTSVLVFR